MTKAHPVHEGRMDRDRQYLSGEVHQTVCYWKEELVIHSLIWMEPGYRTPLVLVQGPSSRLLYSNEETKMPF